MTERLPIRLLVIDPLAEAGGHLLDDDVFWAENLPQSMSSFGLRTSPESIARIRDRLGPERANRLDLRPLPKAGAGVSRYFRIRLLLNAMMVRTRGYDHVLFQSFEEISTLAFMVLNPGCAVHVIVTNNLSPDRFHRHPWLSVAILRAALKRAATVFIHSSFEVDLLQRVLGITGAQVVVKPFHQISAPWPRPPLARREGYVLFMGPPLAAKPLGPCVALIRADSAQKLNYVITAADRIDDPTRAWLASRPNVRLIDGHVPAGAYAELFLNAGLVLLTHDFQYEGRLSGIFCDAVASGTPVVARRMAPFTEYFQRFGPMGLLVDFERDDWCREAIDLPLAGNFDRFQTAAAACRAHAAPEAIADLVTNAMTNNRAS